MAANTTHSAYGTLTAALANADLASKTNTSVSALGTAQDNSTALALLADFVLVLGAQGSNRTAGAKVELYIAYAIDGTNYDVLLNGIKQPVGVFQLDTGVLTATRASITDVPLPPGLWKAYAVNLSTQTTGATGNSLSYRTHSVLTT